MKIEELLAAAGKAEGWLKSSFQKTGALDPPITIKGRVKHADAIKKKIERRKVENPDYRLGNVTDILGFRIVTLFNRDTPSIAEHLLDMLAAGGELRDSRLTQFIQYRAQSQLIPDPDGGAPMDPIESRLREMIASRSLNIDPKFETRPYYSSIHILFDYPVPNKNPAIIVPVEVQIRSAFEDAYLEIDHRLFFDVDRDKGFSEAERNAVKQEIRLLRSLLDNASDLAEMIRARRTENIPESGTGLKPNLDDVGWIDQLVKELGNDNYNDVVKQFVALLQEKDSYDQNPNQQPKSYEGLAEKFEEVEQKFNYHLKHIVPSEEDRLRLTPLAYVIYQEGALCRLLTGDHDQAVAAQRAYDKLNGLDDGSDDGSDALPIKFSFDRYPTAWFRSAQACLQQMETCNDPQMRVKLAADADFRYSEAWKRLKKLEQSDAKYEISSTQHNYLRANLKRLQSFVFWRLSDMRRRPTENEILPPTTEDRILVQRAWDTIAGYARAVWEMELDKLTQLGAEHAVHIYNAALFFIFDGHVVSKRLGVSTDGFPDVEDFGSKVHRFGECLNRIVDPPDRYRHTLMNCLAFLGDREAAKVQADLITNNYFRRELAANLSPYDQQDARRIAKEANLLIRDEDPFFS